MFWIILLPKLKDISDFEYKTTEQQTSKWDLQNVVNSSPTSLLDFQEDITFYILNIIT